MGTFRSKVRPSLFSLAIGCALAAAALATVAPPRAEASCGLPVLPLVFVGPPPGATDVPLDAPIVGFGGANARLSLREVTAEGAEVPVSLLVEPLFAGADSQRFWRRRPEGALKPMTAYVLVRVGNSRDPLDAPDRTVLTRFHTGRRGTSPIVKPATLSAVTLRRVRIHEPAPASAPTPLHACAGWHDEADTYLSFALAPATQAGTPPNAFVNVFRVSHEDDSEHALIVPRGSDGIRSFPLGQDLAPVGARYCVVVDSYGFGDDTRLATSNKVCAALGGEGRATAAVAPAPPSR